MNQRIASAALLLAVLGTAAYGADVYRSTAPDGTVSYSDRPQGADAQFVSRPRDRPATRATTPAAGGAPADTAQSAPQAPARPDAARRPFVREVARAAAEELRDCARDTWSATRCRDGCSARMPPASANTSTTRRSPQPARRQRRMSKTGAVENAAADRTPRTTLMPPPRPSAAADAPSRPGRLARSTHFSSPTSAPRAWCSRSC